jgi:hypothetical protein
MIHSALDFLTKTLNHHIKSISGSSDDHVYLTNISDGQAIAIPSKSLGISLVSIEEERIFKEQRAAFVSAQGQVEYKNPEIKINLFVMVTANFQNQDATNPTQVYKEGLKQLGYVIGFFQANTVFTKDKYPSMVQIDPLLQKLAIEFYSYSFEQMYNFWSVLGTHYMPSVLYKIRLVTFQEQEVNAFAPAIEQISISDAHI